MAAWNDGTDVDRPLRMIGGALVLYRCARLRQRAAQKHVFICDLFAVVIVSVVIVVVSYDCIVAVAVAVAVVAAAVAVVAAVAAVAAAAAGPPSGSPRV